jgi:hypothetical protein
MGQISDDPLTISVAIFKFPISMTEDEDLSDSVHLEITQLSATSNTDDISDQMRILSLDQEKIQSKDFFDPKEDPKNSHDLFSTKRKTPIDNQIFDDELVLPLGHHLGLTIASNPRVDSSIGRV